MLYLFLFIILVSLFLTIKLKKGYYLCVPLVSLFIYFFIQVAMVPMGFKETLTFIMSLR